VVKPKAVGCTSIRAYPRLSCTAQGEATAQHWILDVYRLSSFRSGIKGRKGEVTIILPGNVNTEMLLEKKRQRRGQQPKRSPIFFFFFFFFFISVAIRRWPGS
jgi:hypothetical protein